MTKETRDSSTVRGRMAGVRLTMLGTLGIMLAMSATAGVAMARVDGVPLYPPGGVAYTSTSMYDARMSGPMIAIQATTFPPDGKVQRAAAPAPAILGWNAAHGLNWPVGAYTGKPAAAIQEHPTVYDDDGSVYMAWQQLDDPVTGTWDIYLWKGHESGPANGLGVTLLISGPAGTNQVSPSLGGVQESHGKHVVLAWVDDRDTGGATGEIYMLDLSKDTDHDGTPDWQEATFDPAAGASSGILRVDPSGDLLKGQYDPDVGPTGIYWADDRFSAPKSWGDGTYDTAIYRAALGDGSPHAAVFFREQAGATNDNAAPRANASGAAWVRSGPYPSDQPFAKAVGGTGHVVSFVTNALPFDTEGDAYALVGGHGGASDTDDDIFFYSKQSGQQVPACNVGGNGGHVAVNMRQQQTMPTISQAPGGWRIVWSDARNPLNTSTTAWDDLAWTLYVALVPTVTATDQVPAPVHVGSPVIIVSAVTPNFAGFKVKLQAGKRTAAHTPWGTEVWYSDWKTLKTKKLNAGSVATWTWEPTAKGTFYLRVFFVGGKKYTDVANARCPISPTSARS